MRVIVAMSGGKASAWCGAWALRHFAKSDVVWYFNDTGWEHKDLYRFLSDLSAHFDHPVTEDSDGRNCEELFYDSKSLANNRMPFCSRILKAERLQSYYQDGDTIVFGIGQNEPQREERLRSVYSRIELVSGKAVRLRFPLIEETATAGMVDDWLKAIGIVEPLLYRLGFAHNNCSGGCVRAGKVQWAKLYRRLPEVYAERERVEKEASDRAGRQCTFINGESLEALRLRIDAGDVDKRFDDHDDLPLFDCVGSC